MRWNGVAVAVVIVVVAGLTHQSVAAAAPDVMPDLGMARITDIRLNKTSDGRNLLRFSTTIVNVGAGPFELLGARSADNQRTAAADPSPRTRRWSSAETDTTTGTSGT
jgi:hypothetical protein